VKRALRIRVEAAMLSPDMYAANRPRSTSPYAGSSFRESPSAKRPAMDIASTSTADDAKRIFDLVMSFTDRPRKHSTKSSTHMGIIR